ncbi:hypothetical protein BLNAU_8660 [Blattamonas nauphoetae]|uniref:UBR-type domain-containing protein n=1 Tax=Blattamonas nauphoetae TaxID=2049346 RepID=A0ABQ9XY90_9EUKA|nr:hypothetical protein BLNAU_8660 [Blattamonas nauphoetae]
MVKQPYYQCITCKMGPNSSLCESCASTCHEGHQVVFARNAACFCDCCIECDCKLLPPVCAKADHKAEFQGGFRCNTCKMEPLCLQCIRACHKGHSMTFLDRSRFSCVCNRPSGGSARHSGCSLQKQPPPHHQIQQTTLHLIPATQPKGDALSVLQAAFPCFSDC